MTSEIRTNSLKSRAGLSTVTLTDSGPMFSGITTFVDNSGFNIGTGSSIFSPATNTLTFGTNSNERVRIDSSGRMGLGTNNPEEILHVKAASETVNSRDGVIFQSSSSLAADTGLPLVFSSHIGNDPNYPVASIAGRKENASSGDGAGYLQLATGSSAGAISEKARITSGGLVGIGTISPKLLLHLHQENSNATFAHFTNTTTGVNGNQGVSFGLDSNEDATIYHYGNKNIRFATGGTEKARIDSSGRFLIGETSVAGSTQKLVIGNGGNENFEFSPAMTSNNLNGGLIEYLHRNDGNTRPDLNLYTGGAGAIKFYTNGTERCRVTSAGKVGIAVTNPTGDETFAVKGNIRMRQVNGNSGVNSDNIALYMGMSDDLNQGKTAIVAKPIGSWGRHDLYFCLDDAADLNNVGLGDVRMVITNDGKLLFGTTDTGFSDTYTTMTVGNTSLTNSGITVASSASGIGRLHFADGNSGAAVYAGWIAYNHNANSMQFSTNNSGSEKLSIGPYGEVKITSTSNSHRGLSVIAPATQINFGATHNKGGFLLSTTDGQFSLSGGGYWGGSNWVATASASTQIRHDGGTGPMAFCFNTGLTAGNNFTPTVRLEITPSGNMKLSDPGITFSDGYPYFASAWSGTDGVNTTFTIASTTYANLRFRGEQTTGTEYTMGVGAGIFYMAYDDINNGHRITVAANGVVSGDFNDTSDEKLKKNITSLADGAIDRIKQLRPVNFDWKRESDLNGQSGFIAQEVKTVIPDLVVGEEYVENSIESVGYSVNTNGLVAHLTKAVQEAIAEIETLKTKVATLEEENLTLRVRVTNLEGQ